MVEIKDAIQAKKILARFGSRLSRLEKRAETTEATIKDIKAVIKEEEEIIETYRKEHEND